MANLISALAFIGNSRRAREMMAIAAKRLESTKSWDGHPDKGVAAEGDWPHELRIFSKLNRQSYS